MNNQVPRQVDMHIDSKINGYIDREKKREKITGAFSCNDTEQNKTILSEFHFRVSFLGFNPGGYN